MRKYVVLVLVLGALAGADVLARQWATDKLAEQAASFYPPAGGTSARIESFPFLGRLLGFGSVPRVTVTLTDLGPDVVEVRSLAIDLRDVEVDRGELGDGRVRLTDVGRGRIEVVIDGPSLAEAIGFDVTFGEGTVEVRRRVQGVDVVVVARAEIDGNTLRLVPTSVQGIDVPLDTLVVTYEIPGIELFEGVAEARPIPGALFVAYTFDDVPPALVGRAGSPR